MMRKKKTIVVFVCIISDLLIVSGRMYIKVAYPEKSVPCKLSLCIMGRIRNIDARIQVCANYNTPQDLIHQSVFLLVLPIDGHLCKLTVLFNFDWLYCMFSRMVTYSSEKRITVYYYREEVKVTSVRVVQ